MRQVDEVFLTIKSARHALWRAVDQDGNTLEMLGRVKPPDHAGCEDVPLQAIQGVDSGPWGIMAEKLESDKTTTRESLLSVAYGQHRSLSNRIENSQQPTRQRKEGRLRCTPPGQRRSASPALTP